MKTLFCSLILLLLTSQVQAFVKDPMYDDLEGYDLISVLIKDGKYDLAWEELKRSDIKKGDKNRYQLLMGQYYYGKGEWQKAIGELERISGSYELQAQLFKGRANYQMKSTKACQAAYRRTDLVGLGSESDFIWLSSCQFREKNFPEAWATLVRAQGKFGNFTIEREMISLKINMGLSHEAFLQALEWFGKNTGFPSQYLDVSEEMFAKGGIDPAIALLEQGRARYPMHLDINLTLSQLYFQKNMLMASEEGFSRAAYKDPKYFYHSAEVNRQLGRFERAQFFNGFVVDPKEKLKQKIATYVDAGKFPMIASLESVLSRSELAKDDEIRYALAYSLVKMGEIDGPLKYLSAITKPELIEKTTLLRKTLIDCQEKKGSCRL